MNIIIINKHIYDTLGGSEIQCDLLARGLTKIGHEVIYIAPTIKGFQVSDLPYTLEPVKNKPEHILKAVKRFDPHVVYWRYNLHFFRSVARGFHDFKIPLVFAVSHLNDVRPCKWGRTDKGMLTTLRQNVRRKWNYGGFRYVQALTSLNQDLLPFAPVKKAFYIPNAMDSDVEKFTWPRPFVVWVANLKSSKRPEAFVKAVSALEEYGIDGLMVGNMQSKKYRWLRNDNNTPSNFYYLGPRTPRQVNGLLAASRLHVHTCRPEGFGNIFIQAWLQGRPSVSLGYDPCGYIKEQGIGENANGNMQSFVQQVVKWATQPDKADEAGRRARSFAVFMFTVEAMVENVEKILVEAVNSSVSLA